MDDLKSGYREVKDGAKKVLREVDGKEDLGDKVGNLGDDISRKVGDAGDELDKQVDEQRRDQPTGA